MDGQRIKRLEKIQMVWDPLDAAFEENLAAARVYFADHGTPAAPRSATALDKPIGQWLSNQRRSGALAGRPDRAEALAAIDPDWNPDWPLDWQRHYAAVTGVLGLGAELVDLEEGVTVHGHDVGRWLERQRQHVVWQGLLPGQRERLAALGVAPHPAPAESEKPAKAAPGGRTRAFERGLAALAQYKQWEGTLDRIPRGHVEKLDDGTEVKLGVWISNTKSRRAKLTPEQLDQLAQLGLDWH
jgi:hypothetical protein